MQDRRKRGGHLISKHRYVAAQIEAFLPTICGCDLHDTPTPWRTGRRRPCACWFCTDLAD